MKTKDEKLIKEQRAICIKNRIPFKFKNMFGEWFLIVPKQFVNDFIQLGYNNVKNI